MWSTWVVFSLLRYVYLGMNLTKSMFLLLALCSLKPCEVFRKTNEVCHLVIVFQTL